MKDKNHSGYGTDTQNFILFLIDLAFYLGAWIGLAQLLQTLILLGVLVDHKARWTR